MPAPIRSRWLSKFVVLPLSFFLMSASLFHQTSADKTSRTVELKLHDETLKVNIGSPGVQVELYSDGTLKRLVFHKLAHWHDVRFHHLGLIGEEVVAEIKRFQMIDQQKLLDGRCLTFGEGGDILTENNWSAGLLHGPQRVFNQYRQLIQERYYEHGHPIGSWRILYGDGTLAAETSFPKDRAAWEKTYKDPSKASSIQQMKPTHTLAATEIWYNQDGIKQKERDYRLFKRDGSIMVEATGATRSFDHAGNVIRETKLWNGNGEEIRHLANEGSSYRHRIIWINGGMFRDEWVRHPQSP